MYRIDDTHPASVAASHGTPPPSHEAEGALTGLFGVNSVLRTSETVLQEWFQFYGAVRFKFRQSPPRDKDIADVVLVVAGTLRWLWGNKRILLWQRFQRFKNALRCLTVCCRRWNLHRQRAIAEVVGFWKETERERRERCVTAAVHNRTAPLMRSAQECAVALVSDHTKRAVTTELYNRRWGAWKQQFRKWREEQSIRQALADAEAACQVRRKASGIWGVMKAFQEERPSHRFSMPSCPRFEFGRQYITLYELLKGAGVREEELELFDAAELGIERHSTAARSSPNRGSGMRLPSSTLPVLLRKRSVELPKPVQRVPVCRPHSSGHRNSPPPAAVLSHAPTLGCRGSPPRMKVDRRRSSRAFDDLKQWTDAPQDDGTTAQRRPSSVPQYVPTEEPLRHGSSWRRDLCPLSRRGSGGPSPCRGPSPITPPQSAQLVTPSNPPYSPHLPRRPLPQSPPHSQSRALAAQYSTPAQDAGIGWRAPDPRPDMPGCHLAPSLLPLSCLSNTSLSRPRTVAVGVPIQPLQCSSNPRRDPVLRAGARATPEAVHTTATGEKASSILSMHGPKLVTAAGLFP